MQSYISHRRGRLFNPLIFVFSFLSLSCFIDLLRKISEIIENMIFSLIFALRKIWYFRQMREITKIRYLRSAFLRKCCFSCRVSMWVVYTTCVSKNSSVSQDMIFTSFDMRWYAKHSYTQKIIFSHSIVS